LGEGFNGLDEEEWIRKDEAAAANSAVCTSSSSSSTSYKNGAVSAARTKYCGEEPTA
jgi:hypothetical protein